MTWQIVNHGAGMHNSPFGFVYLTPYSQEDIKEASVVWHAMTAMVLTTKISTSDTGLTVMMFVVEEFRKA